MDIEKTLKAIAESQLRAERRMDLADQRADRADQRMDRLEGQLRVTANLVRKGIDMVLEMRKSQAEMKKSQRELEYKFSALMDAQVRTDEKFNRLLEVLRRRNGNGHR